jgi:hypothetical protein
MQAVSSRIKAAIQSAGLGRQPLLNGILASHLKNEASFAKLG